MLIRRTLPLIFFAAFVTLSPVRAATDALTIPAVEPGEKRLVTVEDIAAIRKIGALRLAPDGEHYAIFVRQGDPATNAYRTGMFAGAIAGGALTPLGAAGHVRYLTRPSGLGAGEIEDRDLRWSPDGKWIAYLARVKGEVQLWRSRADGARQEQVTRHDSDIRDFAWSDDGRFLYFTAGTPRATLQAAEDARSRQGYRYDHDLTAFGDLLMDIRPTMPETDLATWVIAPGGGKARLAREAEREDFAKAKKRDNAGEEQMFNHTNDTPTEPVLHKSGASARLERFESNSLFQRLAATLPSAPEKVISCDHAECLGYIKRFWWSEDGDEIYFTRFETENGGTGFYAWSPVAGKLRSVLIARDDYFTHCAPAQKDALLCVRENKLRPDHVVRLDMRSGELADIADPNPEFRNIRLGNVERFEWETPAFPWNRPGQKLEGRYAKTAFGYILYPPDFDPTKKYPVFIDPYTALGFNSSVGGEHALHAYAANGFIVLDTAFPFPNLTHDSGMLELYSEEWDFPHLSMYAASTFHALDIAIKRGFIDESRTGIGGVSHGTFVPLFMMQKHDRIAAISIATGSWAGDEYYYGTGMQERHLRAMVGDAAAEKWRVLDWQPRPEGDGAKYWDKIDISKHLDTLEGPVLVHTAAREVDGRTLRMLRYMRDDGVPYDAYIYSDETHLKWQPAHIYNIMNRNLDWFRFWLQDYEDPAPEKSEQYSRWRDLRALQCKNPRSLRDYCRSQIGK